MMIGNDHIPFLARQCRPHFMGVFHALCADTVAGLRQKTNNKNGIAFGVFDLQNTYRFIHLVLTHDPALSDALRAARARTVLSGRSRSPGMTGTGPWKRANRATFLVETLFNIRSVLPKSN